MKLHRRSFRAYAAHAKCLGAMLAARALGRRRYADAAREAPTVTLYGHFLTGNLKAFFDYALARDDLPYGVRYATIDRYEYAALAAEYGQNLVLGTTVPGMQRVMASSILMTSHGPGGLWPLKWLCPHIRFVDVWHGLGYKAFSPDDHRMHRFYAATFVSSPFFRDLYCSRYGYGPAQTVVTGYARVDAFQDWCGAAARVRRELGLPEGRRVVLFAPTWRERGEAGEFPFGLSLPGLLEPLNALCERLDATLVFRLHMNSSLRGDTSRWPRVLDLPQARFPDTNALLTATDLAVTDWSSLACDFAVLNRPVVFLDTPEPRSYTSGQTGVPRAGALAGTLEELLVAIEGGLALDEDEVRRVQAPVVEACYGETLDGRSAQRYDEAIRALLESGGKSD